jgi:NADH:ubiquinone oxidoreductase subunit E
VAEPVAGSGPIEAGFDPAEVYAILTFTGRERRHRVAVLSRIQDLCQCLPDEAPHRVVETSAITTADIEGVSSFSARFRRRPAGWHTIRVCVGTARTSTTPSGSP